MNKKKNKARKGPRIQQMVRKKEMINSSCIDSGKTQQRGTKK